MLALAHTDTADRDALRVVFELDSRLGRIVAGTTEPMLGQMRLAWWRDVLAKPPQEWPEGDQVLDGIKLHWKECHTLLLPLIDGWEHLLAEPPLAANAAVSFCEGRRDTLLAALQLDPTQSFHGAACNAGWNWALADLASKVSAVEERDLLIGLAAKATNARGRLPSKARGLAVLGALGRRAIKRGGRPLMEGRGASLVAMRAAITGM